MGLESVSMAASPICTIMGCRKDWKGFYGSVPHLYDNEGKGRERKETMAAAPMCKRIRGRKGKKAYQQRSPHWYDTKGKEGGRM